MGIVTDDKGPPVVGAGVSVGVGDGVEGDE